MPRYLTGDAIAAALLALRESNARSRLCEFLIGVRALRLAESDEVQVAESVPQFMQALDELTRCLPTGVESDYRGQPYFNPFGDQAGYKSRKFRSNGPSNTLHGWATQADSPFSVIPTSPKAIKRRDVTKEQLRKFLLKSGGDPAERPRLIDVAVWFFRARDLETTTGESQTREDLEGLAVDELGLTEDDVAALFRTAAEDSAADGQQVIPNA